ncbi:MAG: hypothetical protein H7247_11880 [Polaromonas sp.]|nr:hypothetical protein [Gemmatimonadaceae bacterium]
MNRTAVALILVLVIAGGCREAGTIVQTGAESVPASITARADVVSTGESAVVTLVLDVRGDVGKVGSFTGRLRFNPAALHYEGEVELSDGTLRASNPGAGVVRVAGASTVGVNVARLAVFHFTVINASAPRNVAFELDELHELSRINLQARLTSSVPAEQRP